jgi:hypothetical protein
MRTAKAQPLSHDQIKSPRRLVVRHSPVEINSRLPPHLRDELLQAYTLSLGVQPKGPATALPGPHPPPGERTSSSESAQHGTVHFERQPMRSSM